MTDLFDLSKLDPSVAEVVASFSELDRVYHASMQAMGREQLPQSPQVSNTADVTFAAPLDLASH